MSLNSSFFMESHISNRFKSKIQLTRASLDHDVKCILRFHERDKTHKICVSSYDQTFVNSELSDLMLRIGTANSKGYKNEKKS